MTHKNKIIGPGGYRKKKQYYHAPPGQWQSSSVIPEIKAEFEYPVIKIGLTKLWGKQILQIQCQTERGVDFGEDNGVFVARNKFKLMSGVYPALDAWGLYVRGSDRSKDTDIIVVPEGPWLTGLKKAVIEYNAEWRKYNMKTLEAASNILLEGRAKLGIETEEIL